MQEAREAELLVPFFFYFESNDNFVLTFMRDNINQ